METRLQIPAKSPTPIGPTVKQATALQRKYSLATSDESRLVHDGLISVSESGLGHSFSRTSVIAVQRKCACGSSSAASSHNCDDCEGKHIQTKLKVGMPNDRYEQEADDLATRVMSMPPPFLFHRPEFEGRIHMVQPLRFIQRQMVSEAEKDEEEEGLIQMKPKADFQTRSPSKPNRDAGSLAETTEQPLFADELMTGGSALPWGIRSYFEPRLGYDLSSVRIHQGSQSDRLNDRLMARAFTIGSHVWLGQDQPLRTTHTLAHEFVHVIQQTQPRMLPNAAAVQGESTLRADRSIQRDDVFWGPERGADPADEVQDAIVALNTGIKKEVGVPGSVRAGEKDTGRADLYKSKNGKRIGLYFARWGERNCYLDGVPQNLVGGQAPRISTTKGRLELLHLADAPTDIKLGEVKPLAYLERRAGTKQVDGYVESVERTARLLQELRDRDQTTDPKKVKKSDGCPYLYVEPGVKDTKWSPNADLLEPKDYGADFEPETLVPVAEVRGRSLALYRVGAGGTREKEGVILPEHLKRRVLGDLHYAVHTGDNAGVVTYAWLLRNPIDLETESRLLTKRQLGFEARARAAHNRLVVPLLKPVQSQAPTGTVQPLLKSPQPIRQDASGNKTLRRQPTTKEPPGTDSNFNLTLWLADQKKLKSELKSNRVAEGNETVKFLAGAVKAEKLLKRLLPNAKVPEQVKGEEGIEKKRQVKNLLTGAPGLKKNEMREMTLPEMVALVELWTSKRVVPLAYLRKAFGGFIAGIFNWMSGVPEKFRKWRKDRDLEDDKISDNDANKASKHNKVITGILRIAWKALKIAFVTAFGQAAELLFTAAKRGVFNRLRKLFIFDVLNAEDPNGPLAYALGLHQQLESAYEQVRSLVGDALKPLLDFIKQFSDFYGFLKNFSYIENIISKLQMTLKLIKYSSCAAGGWLGILKCLFTNPAQDLMLAFLSICSIRKEIAGLLFGLSWVRSLPVQLANLMRDAIISLLPPSMKDLIDEIKFGKLDSIELGCDPPPPGVSGSGSGQPGKATSSGQAGTGGAGGGSGSATPGAEAGEGEGILTIDAKNKAGIQKSDNIVPGYAVVASEPQCSDIDDGKKGKLYKTIDVVVQDQKTKSQVVVIRNVKVKIVKVFDLGAGVGRVKYSALNAEPLCPAEPADVRSECQAALPPALHNATLRTDLQKGSIAGHLPYCSQLEKLKE